MPAGALAGSSAAVDGRRVRVEGGGRGGTERCVRLGDTCKPCFSLSLFSVRPDGGGAGGGGGQRRCVDAHAVERRGGTRPSDRGAGTEGGRQRRGRAPVLCKPPGLYELISTRRTPRGGGR
eukprot:167128-Chlamydomonas_euryale.AAC.4